MLPRTKCESRGVEAATYALMSMKDCDVGWYSIERWGSSVRSLYPPPGQPTRAQVITWSSNL